MRNKLIILLLLSLFKVTPSFSQIDTSFWFAAPWVTPDHWWKDPIRIHISTFAAPTTTVRVRQPAAIAPNKYDTTIVINANSNFDYTFWRDAGATLTNRGYDSLECWPSNSVVPYGLYISSSSNITVVYDVITRTPNFYNPETLSLMGQNGFGTEFVCPFQTRWRNQTIGDLGGTPPGVEQPKQQINIVATKPNTTVWITPKCAIIGHPANISYSIILVNPGDAYTVENSSQLTNTAGNNLSGTVVVSDKPIAVTVADDSVAGVTGCYDLMAEQIVPVDIVGTDYILNKGFMNAPEHEGAYVVGTENFTQLTINDGVTTTTLINKGDTYHYKTTQGLTYVNASKPVYCLHASGTGCELGEAILPPLNCAGSQLVSFSRTNPQNFYLNILCKNGAQGSFTLNNSAQSVSIPITAANFTIVPGTGTLVGGPFFGCQLNLSNTATLPIGSYTIYNSSSTVSPEFALGVFGGNASTGGLFHYMSSFLRRTTVTTQTLSPICAGPGVTVALTGTVSGGAITGAWTTSASGTFGPYTSTLNTVSTIYTLSNLDTNATSIKFYLTSSGNCTPKKDSVILYINQRPQVSAAITPSALCKNNYGSGFTLAGVVTNVIATPGTGLWTGGNGGSYGSPGVNTSYTPSPADVASGSIIFTLTSQGPKAGCVNTSKTFSVGFMDFPVVTLPTTTIACTNSSSMALTGTVTGSPTGYLWSSSGTGIFTPGSNSLNVAYLFSAGDLAATSITLTLSASNPSCTGSSDQIVVNIIPAPVVALSGPTLVCASNSLIPFPVTGTVSGGGASSILWGTTNGTGAFSVVSPTTVNNYQMSAGDAAITGSLIIYGNSNGGFCPTVSDTLRIPIVPNLTLTTNPSTAVCEFTPIQLMGSISGTNTGFWSTAGTGSFVPTNTLMNTTYYPSAGDLANGTVTFSLFANSTCFTPPRTFTATFVKSPAADFSFSSKRCIGDPIIFNSTSSANSTTITAGSWDFGNGNFSNNPTTAISTYTSAGIYSITFTVTGTNSLNISCSDTVTKKISVNPLPNPDFTSNNSCVGLISTFQNLSIPANGQFNWNFGGNAIPAVSTASAPNVIFNVNGPISVQLKETIAATQCTASIIKTVNVNPQPDAKFGMTNNPTVAQEPVYFSDFSTPTGAIATWIWSFGDETSAQGQSPTHSYQNGGSFLVTLTVLDSLGCSDTAIRRIEVNLIPQVPTGFTPNGDGTNDRLFVKGGPFNKMIFRIYNNWGEKIYESEDQSEGWDGKKDGKDQPVGVYVWTLEVDLYNNRTVKKNGDVTLMR